MQKKSKKNDIEVLADLPVQVEGLLLKDRFSAYQNPTKKIFDLLKKQYLVSIKRGTYFNMKSKEWEALQMEVVANALYQPSYISAEWALQYYGLLLDRVYTVTSVTTRRSKQFSTPAGEFSYDHIPKKRYPVGYTLQSEKTQAGFFIARPEKALVDYVNLRAKDLQLSRKEDIPEFLENDLRLDLSAFLKMVRVKDLQEILPCYHRNSKEARILKWLIARKETGRGKSN